MCPVDSDGREIATAFAVSPLTPALSPVCRGEGVISRATLRPTTNYAS